MTTIAFDGVTLASDSLVSTSGRAHPNLRPTKIMRRGGLVFAAAGTLGNCEAFADWYLGDQRGKCPLREDDPAWVITPPPRGRRVTKLIEFSGGLDYTFIVQPPCAIGTGESFAIAAMLAGANATRAVRIACKIDVLSGGPVKTIKVVG